jgi:predicted DNA-binding transcriptional regulator AlpA
MSTSLKALGALEEAISEAVNTAVKAAIAEQIAPAIAELRQRPQAEHLPPEVDRFVSMSEMCQRLGIHRGTVLRRERMGKLPRRQTYPDGRVGWSSLVVDSWFKRAVELPPNKARNADLAARIHGVQ